MGQPRKARTFFLQVVLTVTALFFAYSTAVSLVYASRQLSPPSAPAVSREFQTEVARLTATGLRLKEAMEADLDGSYRCLAAVFERIKPNDPAEAFEFRIIESDGSTPKTIFRRAEFFFSLPRETLIKENGADINGDGFKEFVVQSSSGGNCWSCNPAEVYRVRNHKGELIAAGPIQRIVDLNGDGLLELLITDARWEVYEELSHAAAPSAVMIYSWREGSYVYSSPAFGDYYRSEVERLRASVTAAASEITTEDFSDEAYVGRSLALALTFAHMGQVEHGLKELESLMKARARTAEQSRRRAAVLNDFRGGESSKKLREIKPGDPIPMG